jgi:L-ascorbate metabolism protein UlaG (beta-lactamase superfamily)
MRESEVTLRWLGVAGFELAAGGRVILVDPYLTRISFFHQWAGKVRPDELLIRRTLPCCNAILISHSHYDHLMDAPVIATATGAHVYGSANTCELLRTLGVPRDSVHEVGPGSGMSVDGIAVEVHEAAHPPLPAFRPGPLAPRLQPPLSARRYRMDVTLSYRITAGGTRFLTDPGRVPPEPLPAEVLFLAPHMAQASIEALLGLVKPRLVIPTHWDNMWKPLREPLQPALYPPRMAFPPIGRIDVSRFRRIVEELADGTRVFIPERLEAYTLSGLLG